MEHEGSLPPFHLLPTVPILSQIHPVHATHPISWRSILNFFLSMSASSKWSLSLRFPHKTLYASLLSPYVITSPAHLILLDLITQIIFGEQYRPSSSSLCSVSYTLVTSSLLSPNIISALLSNTLSLRSSLNMSDHVYTHTKQRAKLYFCIS